MTILLPFLICVHTHMQISCQEKFAGCPNHYNLPWCWHTDRDHQPRVNKQRMIFCQMQVIGWTSNYQETLRELGLEDEDVVFPQGPDRGYTLLVERYIQRTSSTLHTWFVNILEVSRHNSLTAAALFKEYASSCRSFNVHAHRSCMSGAADPHKMYRVAVACISTW